MGMDTGMHNIAAVAASYTLTMLATLGAFLTGLVPSMFVIVVSLMAMCGVLGFAVGYSVERRRLLAERISRLQVRAFLR